MVFLPCTLVKTVHSQAAGLSIPGFNPKCGHVILVDPSRLHHMRPCNTCSRKTSMLCRTLALLFANLASMKSINYLCFRHIATPPSPLQTSRGWQKDIG